VGGALLAARSPASPAPREECTIEQELQAWQGLPCACLSVGRIRAFADWVTGVRRSRGSFFIYLFGCVDFFDYHYFYFLFFFSRASSPEFYCGPDLSAGAEKPRGALPSGAEPSLLPRAPPADRPPWPSAGRGLAAGPRSGGRRAAASPPSSRGLPLRRGRAEAGAVRAGEGARRREKIPRPRGARRRRRGEKERGCEGMCPPAAGSACLG